ncbi:hypothetical protein G6011_01156 [Alternaria panax]|uniref:Uncharacterized protein n=1 Tax=Alternaria panax TaxID=48097 RepID=A0AAD4IJZ4_9PLEO|nr:hypothetical protein G6011_01156 [Alternaria panax]
MLMNQGTMSFLKIYANSSDDDKRNSRVGRGMCKTPNGGVDQPHEDPDADSGRDSDEEPEEDFDEDFNSSGFSIQEITINHSALS